MSSVVTHYPLTRCVVLTLILGASSLSGCYKVAGDGEADASDDGDTGPGSSICTGGNELWVGYQLYASWSYDAPGHAMFEENGWRSFVIDRSCRFYVIDGTDGDRENRYYGLADFYTGTLTDKEARAVQKSLSMEDWGEYYGKEYVADGEECGTAYFFDTTGVFGCKCSCEDFPEPSKISSVGATIAERLVLMGTPMTGPLRVITMLNDDDCSFSYKDGEDPQKAPASFDPASIAIDPCTETIDTGAQSRLLEGSTASDLRAIRKEYREDYLDDNEDIAFYRVPMENDLGRIYDVFMRDYVPLEDGKGIINPHDTTGLQLLGGD